MFPDDVVTAGNYHISYRFYCRSSYGFSTYNLKTCNIFGFL